METSAPKGTEVQQFRRGVLPTEIGSYADDPCAQAIAAAAARLNEVRENWLNPSDLVEAVDEVVPDYPKRLLPRDERAAAILKTRTLTNLYNQRPAWLVQAHAALDAAVADAYGWPADLSDEEVLERLLALNHARLAASENKRRKKVGKLPNPNAPQFFYSFSGDKAEASVSTEAGSPGTILPSVQSGQARKLIRTG